MKLVILPGNSLANKDWAHELANKIDSSTKSGFEQVLVQDYRHWQISEPELNIQFEADRLAEITHLWKNYSVIAKSAGSLVLLRAWKKLIHKPQSISIFGLPIKWAEERDINILRLLKHITSPITFIQNINDPMASADKIEELIALLNLPTKLIPIEGSTHDYSVDLALEQIKNHR